MKSDLKFLSYLFLSFIICITIISAEFHIIMKIWNECIISLFNMSGPILTFWQTCVSIFLIIIVGGLIYKPT